MSSLSKILYKTNIPAGGGDKSYGRKRLFLINS